MEYDVSIFLAGIRVPNWKALYDSAQSSISRSFEMIFVGPYDLPNELKNVGNVKYIKDFGCPSRCYQIGLLESTGKYVVWAADDGVFTKKCAIDKAFKLIESLPYSKKNMVTFKYFEGKETRKSKKQMFDEWWRIRRHPTLSFFPYVNSDYFMVMNGLIDREYFLEMGGWDCQFEHLGLGSVDLSIRLQNDGANVILGKRFMDISHLPDVQGDHAPIHFAQTENDWPLFKKIYSDPSSSTRSKIDINNWRYSDAIWPRRKFN